MFAYDDGHDQWTNAVPAGGATGTTAPERQHRPDPRRRARRRASGLAGTIIVAMAAAMAIPATASAQGIGVFDQPFQSNPFQPLLSDRATLAFNFQTGLSNNTFGVGDLWAINELQDDFRGTDVFLIAGLIPPGEGLTLNSQTSTRVDLAVLPLPFSGRLGISAGAHAFADASVPDGVTSLLRDGTAGSELTVDFTDLGATALAYGDVAALGVFDLPFMPLPGIRMRAGLGAHYLHGIAYQRLAFDGDGDAVSRVTVSHDGIAADINGILPLDVALPNGGTGYAVDLFAGAELDDLYVGAMIKNMGVLNILEQEREVSNITLNAESFGDFFDAVDTTATDTIDGGERSITLPGVVRLEASYTLHRMARIGAAIEQPFGEFRIASPIMARAELRPLPFLPIRFGGSLGGIYGSSYQLGFGFDLSVLRWDVEAISRGGSRVEDMRGITFATAFALRI